MHRRDVWTLCLWLAAAVMAHWALTGAHADVGPRGIVEGYKHGHGHHKGHHKKHHHKKHRHGHGGGGGGAPAPGPTPDGWRCATATAFESYPTTDAEGIGDSGYKYEGQFAATDKKYSKSEVASMSIVSVNEKDFDQYKNKSVIIQDPGSGRTVTAKVLDLCSSRDCGGCCDKNAAKYGCDFLLDIEINTLRRLMGGHVDAQNFMQKVNWKLA